MISLEDVASAMPAAESLLPRLQGMYQALPETICTCDQPGVCCHSLPEITALEAVSMIRLMQGMGDGELTATARRFAELFLTDPARQTTCPFLREGACTIYVHRPFACRAYGLWSQDLGAIKTQESREA
ncbi:MAG: YkgJ family cysteine cluster protein, partial [Deltaproteobacteria bacterium]|nr:YkgJ family cysteine cluster protein [Deltaproteobacteria bacterium]